MKIVKIKLEIAKGTIVPIASINYDPENLIKETLVWKSITPEIVGVNDKTDEICATQCGCGTVCAEDKNGATRVYCVINVKDANENMVTKESTTMFSTSGIEPISRMYSNWYDYNTTDTINAVGYSGKSFSYSKTGTYVTLESGGNTKSGTQNTDSSLFRSELVNMNDISASIAGNDILKKWAVPILADIVMDIVRPFTFGYSIIHGIPEATLFSYLGMANNALLVMGIDLGDSLQPSLELLVDWAVAEHNAEIHFDDFN